MELRHLRYFVAVAQHGHFGRAARDLHLTSSSLSQQIRALERDLRTELFDRTPAGTSLTPAGHALLEHALTVLARADRARDAVHDTGPARLALRVAPGVAAALAPGLRAAASGIVDAAISHEADAVAAVAQERADAALVWVGAATGDLCRRPVGEVGLLLALPAAHPLATARAVPVTRLGDLDLLAPGHLARALRRCGSPVEVRAVADPGGDPDHEIRRQVRAGGIGLLCHAGAGDRADVAVRAVTPLLTVTVEMVWRDPAPPGLLRVAQALRRVLMR